MIKIEYLRYFKVTADKGSFSAAGDALHVSATSVVHGVNSLEDHFGTCLFVRRKAKGITLTTDGEKLLERVKGLMLEIETIDETFKSTREKLKGELVVGCQEGLSWCLTPRVIGQLTGKHPDLKISTKTIWMDDHFTQLENGEIDMLVTFLVSQAAPSNCDCTVLCRPRTLAMMRQGHPLDNGQEVYLADLANYEQILISDGPGYELFHGMFFANEQKPEKITLANISTSAQSIVGRGDAVSLRYLTPAHKISPLGDPIVYPRVADDLVRPDLVVITRKVRSQANALKQEVFIQECQKLFDSGEMRQHMNY